MALSIAGKQITAARALADLTVAELAERAGLSRDAIMKIEAGTVQPREGTIADITRALAAAGVEFTEKGARWIDDVIRVLDSEDAYLRMLDDVHQVTRKAGGEVLFFCSDDRSTRPGEEEAEERIRANGVRFRCLIEAGNNFTRWPLPADPDRVFQSRSAGHLWRQGRPDDRWRRENPHRAQCIARHHGAQCVQPAVVAYAPAAEGQGRP
jgi:transcriptional regulator with XRE-family HTH domain